MVCSPENSSSPINIVEVFTRESQGESKNAYSDSKQGRVQGIEYKVQGIEYIVKGTRYREQGTGYRVQNIYLDWSRSPCAA